MDIQATRQNNNYHQYAVSKIAETPRSLWAPFVVQRLHLTWRKEEQNVLIVSKHINKTHSK